MQKLLSLVVAVLLVCSVCLAGSIGNPEKASRRYIRIAISSFGVHKENNDAFVMHAWLKNISKREIAKVVLRADIYQKVLKEFPDGKKYVWEKYASDEVVKWNLVDGETVWCTWLFPRNGNDTDEVKGKVYCTYLYVK